MNNPSDYALFELVPDLRSPTGKSPRAIRPSDVVRVRDKVELSTQLKFYAHPLLGTVVPATTFARRWYVEKVRPALRFYCSQFGVAVPPWLADEASFKELPEAEKQDLFGTTDLRVREFAPVVVPQGSVARAVG